MEINSETNCNLNMSGNYHYLSFTAQQVYMTESPPPYPGIEPTAPPQPMNGHPQESAAGQHLSLSLSLSFFLFSFSN